jgi:hypothetical protein
MDADLHEVRARCGTPRSTSPKSAPMRLSCGGSQQTSVPQPSRPPCVLGKKLDRSVPVVPTPAISAPTVSKPGRHRRPTSPKLIVWGFAFTSRRLALMEVLTLLVVVSTVLFAVS